MSLIWTERALDRIRGIAPGQAPIRFREYGSSGAHVIVLHGGPGAPGHMAPVARRLAERFHVVEPFQRGSEDGAPLTVMQHAADLHEIVQSLESTAPVLLAGSSWGAMLALAYAADHSARLAGIALIGCGTFDAASRHLFRDRLEARLTADIRAQIARLEAEVPDPDARLLVKAEILLPAYSYELITSTTETIRADARANHETWQDMLRLQEAGVYPAAFGRINAPVLMLHGAVDPHPGPAIRDSLLPHLPQLVYHEWAACGHYPWLERLVHEEFFELLSAWLTDAVQNFSG
jgi:pimeloyl-ACP methyl ester carboxylesterase